jgi:diadenosine tetraphosphatase ApaH/serine/threonine PP2A family protein phosphatase
MVVAILADVHANSEALSSCLAHARRAGAERFVFLGDHVGYGADPATVVETIRELVERGQGVAVLGNHDLAAARAQPGQMHEEARRVIEWTRAQLTAQQLEFLLRLPIRIEEHGRLYVHANAWAPAEWDYITGVFDAGRSLRATSCRLTFCGHVHTPALYHMAEDGRVSTFTPAPAAPVPLTPARRWLAIPGSVGQPRDGNPAAAYALFDEARSILTWFRVPYDTEAAARKILRAGLPESFGARLEAGL